MIPLWMASTEYNGPGRWPAPGCCSTDGPAEIVELQQPHLVLANVVDEGLHVHRVDRLAGAANLAAALALR